MKQLVYQEGDIGKVLEERRVIRAYQTQEGYGVFQMSLIVSPCPSGYGPPVPIPHYRFIRESNEDEFLNQNDLFGGEGPVPKSGITSPLE